MDSLHGILHGLAVAATPMHLLYTLIGVFIGTMISICRASARLPASRC